VVLDVEKQDVKLKDRILVLCILSRSMVCICLPRLPG